MVVYGLVCMSDECKNPKFDPSLYTGLRNELRIGSLLVGGSCSQPTLLLH